MPNLGVIELHDRIVEALTEAGRDSLYLADANETDLGTAATACACLPYEPSGARSEPRSEPWTTTRSSTWYWNRDSDPWLRRMSVVIFTRSVAASGRLTDVALELCDNLDGDAHPHVRKGIAWTRRDLAKAQ